MSRIVVLSTIYIGMPSANGICARNLVDELKKHGHCVEVICYQSKDKELLENQGIFQIEEKQQAKSGIMAKIKRAVKRAPGIVTKSAELLLEEKLVNDYFNKLMELQKSKPIDAVVAMFFPLEALAATNRFKNCFPGVKTLVYELDSVGDGIANSRRQRLYNSIYEKWLNKVYSSIDSIILMESHKEYWIKTFNTYTSKASYADIPVLIPKESTERIQNDKCRMIYSGIIEKQYRAPTYLLDVLLHLCKKMEYQFSFYSKGDCEPEIAEAAKQYSGIEQKGFVTPEELDLQLRQADFLVSIGNAYSRSVPSKLISYVAYGKPIIHFTSQKNDVCVEYLENYPLALIVNQSKPITESVNQLYHFVKKNTGSHIEINDIKDSYFMNNPGYSAQLIENTLGLN